MAPGRVKIKGTVPFISIRRQRGGDLENWSVQSKWTFTNKEQIGKD
jgi:hypothetical protein